MKKYSQEELEYFAHKSKNISLVNEDSISAFTSQEGLKELIDGFLDLIVNLREDMEAQAPILLQQIYSNLYGSVINNPAKCIIKIHANVYHANEAIITTEDKFSSEGCYFSLTEHITIWPLVIKKHQFIRSNLLNNLDVETSYVWKITFSSLNIAIRKMSLNHIRLFINGKDVVALLRDLFLHTHKVKAYVANSNDKKLQPIADNFYSECDITWQTPPASNGIDILNDYGNIPEIFQFITINNIDLNNIFEDLCIYIPINLSEPINVEPHLWCVVAKNEWMCQTDSFKIDLEHLQQKLIVNSFKQNIYINEVLKCYILYKNKPNELISDNNKNWCAYRKNNDTYISFLKEDIMDFNKEWAYCDVLVNNGDSVNSLNSESVVVLENDSFACEFLVSPSYTPLPTSMQTLFTYLNTDYKHLLSSEETFMENMNNLIHLYMKEYFVRVETVNIEKTLTHRKWGRYTVPVAGKYIKLTIKTNLPNPFVFLKVLHTLITDLSSLNISIGMETEWKGIKYIWREEDYET